MVRTTTVSTVVGSVLSMAVFTGSGFAAAPNVVANTTQKGSLMIFPNIDVTPANGTPDRDTIVRLHNDGTANIDVECHWKNGTKFHTDFSFTLTPKQPLVFRASTGADLNGSRVASPFPTDIRFTNPPFGSRYQGELKCWAVDFKTGNQLIYNHLSGSAIVTEGENPSYEYNSWNFAAHDGVADTDKTPVGVPGVIRLDGIEYDACPLYLHGRFFAAGEGNSPEVVLASCDQDLRQDSVETFTKAQFKAWNEREADRSGSYHCMDSWVQVPLAAITYAGSNFTAAGLGTPVGQFKVKGVASTQCSRSGNAGLVGIRIDRSPGGAVAAELNGAGRSVADNKILYDPAGDVGPVPQR